MVILRIEVKFYCSLISGSRISQKVCQPQRWGCESITCIWLFLSKTAWNWKKLDRDYTSQAPSPGFANGFLLVNKLRLTKFFFGSELGDRLSQTFEITGIRPFATSSRTWDGELVANAGTGDSSLKSRKFERFLNNGTYWSLCEFTLRVYVGPWYILVTFIHWFISGGYKLKSM